MDFFFGIPGNFDTIDSTVIPEKKQLYLVIW